MTYDDLADVLDGTGMDWVPGAFTRSTPSLPYVILTRAGTVRHSADCISTFAVDEWRIELYTQGTGFERQRELARALTDAGFSFTQDTGGHIDGSGVWVEYFNLSTIN